MGKKKNKPFKTLWQDVTEDVRDIFTKDGEKENDPKTGPDAAGSGNPGAPGPGAAGSTNTGAAQGESSRGTGAGRPAAGAAENTGAGAGRSSVLGNAAPFSAPAVKNADNSPYAAKSPERLPSIGPGDAVTPAAFAKAPAAGAAGSTLSEDTEREKAMALLAAADKALTAKNAAAAPFAQKSLWDRLEAIVPGSSIPENRPRGATNNIRDGIYRYFLPEIGIFGGGTAETMEENLQNTWATEKELGPNGVRAFYDTYQPTNSPKAFSQIYQQGKSGVPFRKAVSVAWGYISLDSAWAAYMAARKDAQVEKISRKSVPEAQPLGSAGAAGQAGTPPLSYEEAMGLLAKTALPGGKAASGSSGNSAAYGAGAPVVAGKGSSTPIPFTPEKAADILGIAKPGGGEFTVHEMYDMLLENLEKQSKTKAGSEGAGRKILNYIQDAADQIVLGNYTDKVNALGTLGQLAAGFFDVDLGMDMRDLVYDLDNWEWSGQHAGQTALDAIGLVPVLGMLKYADEVSATGKNAANFIDNALDSAQNAGKHADDAAKAAGDAVKHTDEATQGIAEGAGDVGKIITEVKYTPSSGAILKANPKKTTTIWQL